MPLCSVLAAQRAPFAPAASRPCPPHTAVLGPAGYKIKAKGIELDGVPMYLDMQSTTPLDPRVLDSMLPYLTNTFGNPHSRTHLYGWESEDAVEAARAQIASSIGSHRHPHPPTCPPPGASEPTPARVLPCPQPKADVPCMQAASRVVRSLDRHAQLHADQTRVNMRTPAGASPREIIFTSGATEANNMAIKGAAHFYREKKRHIITTQTEHKCVLDSCRVLQQQGFDVTYLPVDAQGLVDVEAFRAAIRPDTVLASIMFVNNEIGVIQPMAELGAICREHKARPPAVQPRYTLPAGGFCFWHTGALRASAGGTYTPSDRGDACRCSSTRTRRRRWARCRWT